MRKILCMVGFLLLTSLFVSAQNNLNHIYFKTASSTLSTEAKKTLNKFIDTYDPESTALVELVGHTDAVGTQSYNEELALRRARSVKDYLLRKGIDAERILMKTFGETQPLMSNREESGRKQNRRVSFVWGDGSFAWLNEGTEIQQEELLGMEFLGEIAPYEYNEREIAMRELVELLAPKQQIFGLKKGIETRIVTKGGAVLFVPYDVLETEDGSEIEAPVKLKIRECIDRSDMVFTGLDSHSPEGMLESGGMFQILAYSGNKKLKLKEGRKVELYIPTAEVKEGMGLYTTSVSPPADPNLFGDWEQDSNWKLPDSSRYNSVKQTVWLNMKESEKMNFRKPVGEFVETLIDTSWQNDVPVIIENTYIYRKPRPSLEYLRSRNKPYFYGLNLSRLGWINCDRFISDRRPKTELFVKSDYETPMLLKLVFKRQNGIMSASYLTGSYLGFSSLPVGEKVTLVAIGKGEKEKELVFATKDFRISENMKIDELELRKGSMLELKSYLSGAIDI
ncbi:MAG: OmpA family protein [Bacteroidia bacterium]|nr:OmpA family protein [Bacteroidia bacterium]